MGSPRYLPPQLQRIGMDYKRDAPDAAFTPG